MIEKQLAHFEVLGKLGEGGMGVVYRARDTKLDREVALKVLPASFMQDAERLARFRREAKVLASLNHANIASIYGLEEAEGHHFLVMELAEGEDLTERIARGAMGAEEVLDIARQLVAGLEEAHESGVVHRDLKPANIKLSEHGKVKILDFGLARAWAEDPQAEEDLANSPTITAAMTQAGVILGTAAYMSPEQARGKAVDRRADIWSLGVILFEMLTGQRLFEGETVSDTLAGVLKTDVDFSRLPEDTPEPLRWLIVRCLQRHAGERLRDVGEARIALGDPDPNLSMSWSAPAVGEVPTRSSGSRPVLLAALALLIGATGAWFLRPMPEAPSAAGLQAALLAPDGYEFDVRDAGHVALSPDGSALAFVALDSSASQSLWVRRLDVAAPYQLSGTEGASYPFWSPDGETIGFFSEGRMRKIDAGGGVATTICAAPTGRGGSWMTDGRILFAPTNQTGIEIVSSAGGEPVAVTALDSTERSHRWPDILPGGTHFLFSARTGNRYRLQANPLDGGPALTLLETANGGLYDDGHIFFSRDQALWARPFDPATLSFTDEEFLIAETVMSTPIFGGGCFTASDGGNLVYAATGIEETGFLVGMTSDGREDSRFRTAEGSIEGISLSPDNRSMLMHINPAEGSGDPDIWIRDLRRETMTRFTSNESARMPQWSPDGERIAYSRNITNELVIRSARGARELIAEVPSVAGLAIHDWSSDGQHLLISFPGSAGNEMGLIPIEDLTNITTLVANDGYNVHGAFSPDGDWLVHMSTVTGNAETYLKRAIPGGDSYQVSSSGGIWPFFSPDGSSIYFVDEQQRLRVVDVDWSGSDPDLGIERVAHDIRIRPGRRSLNQVVPRADGGFYYMADARSAANANVALQLVVGWRQLFLGQD